MAGKKTDFSKFNPALSIISRPIDEEAQEQKEIEKKAEEAAAQKTGEDKPEGKEENKIKIIEEETSSAEKEFDELEQETDDDKSVKKKKVQGEALRSFSFKLNKEDYTLMRFVCGLHGISMNEYIVKLIRADMKNYETYIDAVKGINPELFD